MSRSQFSTAMGFSLVALVVACSTQPVGPAPTSATKTAFNREDAEAATPASVGWQQEARALVGAHNMSPLAAARVYAALGVAQYRAVLAVDPFQFDKLPPQAFAGGRSSFQARRGAVAGASAEVLKFFFPAAASSLEQRVETEGSIEGKMHPQFMAGELKGRSAGLAMVERTRNDRFTAPWTGSVPTGPGMWVANGPPAGATLGAALPYFLTSGSQFRPAAPPAFGSPAFLADLAEIKTLATNRTAEQRAIALYWNFGTGTMTPPGYWNLATSNYIQAGGLDERAAAHAFALTNAAMMDSFIGCWDAKYHYWTLRPSHADNTISMVFGLPNHPSYPSGHSCASAAAETVLAHLFPDRAAEVGGWVTEAGLSRIYAGIHYRFDITAGQNLGVAVAQWAIAHDQQLGLVAALTR